MGEDEILGLRFWTQSRQGGIHEEDQVSQHDRGVDVSDAQVAERGNWAGGLFGRRGHGSAEGGRGVFEVRKVRGLNG